MRALVARDLADSKVAGLSADRRFATAYNAALQAGGDKEASLYGRGMAKDLQAGAAAGAADIKSALALDARIATTFADSGVKP